MWSNLRNSRPARRGLAFALFVAVVVTVILLWPRSPAPSGGERTRAELDLREGILYAAGDDNPFTGTLIEDYGKDARKLEIAIRDGKADGISRGWFEDGQIEVEELFRKGVSNGIRTRWYPNGARKSEATIVDGIVTDRYVTWHDNGQRAAEVIMADGKAHGLAEAWHPSGKLKSRVELDRGIPGGKEYFPDGDPITQAGEPAQSTAP